MGDTLSAGSSDASQTCTDGVGFFLLCLCLRLPVPEIVLAGTSGVEVPLSLILDLVDLIPTGKNRTGVDSEDMGVSWLSVSGTGFGAEVSAILAERQDMTE
jgi:hypothetical protein